LGILFHIKDDELGLFADPAALGKPVGADIRENKKTLYRHYLFERADEQLKSQLLSWFGSPTVDTTAVATVRQAIEDLGVRRDLAKQMDELATSTRQTLGPLLSTASPSLRQTVEELIEYSLNRAY
jgi:geranylgeranyl diphosphate synthase, type I